MTRPEAILQFGAGNFLRGFADLFVHQAQQRGDSIGSIVVVQSTGAERARLINQCGGHYHVVVRGLHDGQIIDRVEECASISRALMATTQWDEVLAVARSPQLQYIVSNTTEAGYSLDLNDAEIPTSFPAKLRAVLLARWQAGLPPVTLLPCELIEDNAGKLCTIVTNLSRHCNDPAAFIDWVSSACVWLASLVDRIVPGRPDDHPLCASDPLLLVAEPYSLWALQTKPGAHPWIEHPAIVRTSDVSPFFLRKVRILNGAHSALACQVGLNRFETVLDAMNDSATAAWLKRLLFDEIVPVLEGRCDDPRGFALQTLERFRNPFLRHKLSDIAVNHDLKKSIRLEPTLREYRTMYGKQPALLSAMLKQQ